MKDEYDPKKFTALREEARKAFLTDSAYAIAIARPAGALVARRREREAVGASESPEYT